jgi:1-acylglycerone phosphate reductase
MRATLSMLYPPLKMSQKYILIPGCSLGSIGDALAQKFLKRGFYVFATARDLKRIPHPKDLGCAMS